MLAIVFGGGMQAGSVTGAFSTTGVCKGGALIGGKGLGLGPQLSNIRGTNGAHCCWQGGRQPQS